MRPEFPATFGPLAPTLDMRDSTFGSLPMMSATAIWCSLHRVEGDPLRRLGEREEQPGVLVRQEPLGDGDEQVRRRGEEDDGKEDRGPAGAAGPS